MINWLNYIIESCLILGLLLAFYKILLSNEKCVAYNRFYLLLTVVASVVIPFLNLPYFLVGKPTTETLEPFYELPIIVSQITTFPDKVSSGFETMIQYIGIIYLTGVAYFLYIFSLKIVSLITLIRHSKERHIGLKFKIILTQGKHPSFSFGNYIFLNQIGKTPQDIEAIIAHELAHIKQKHTIDVFLIEVYKIIFWFNPLSHYLDKAIRLNHEYLADLSVVREKGKHMYVKTLLNNIYQNTIMGVVHYFGLHSTERRVKMIQKNFKLSAILKPYVSMPFIAILIFAFSCHMQPELIEPTYIGLGKAPKEFENIFDSLQLSHPDRTYFFKRSNHPNFERVKAYDYKQLSIDYVAALREYKESYGLIYSFASNTSLYSDIFSSATYALEETSQIPIPRNGYGNLLRNIDEVANENVKVTEDKTIWVTFVVTATGSICKTNIVDMPYSNLSEKQAKEYGAVINAVNKVSQGQWRAGKIRNTPVDVALEIPVRLYKN